MSDIKWKEGVAFFVGGKQWREHTCGDLSCISSDDFQLNEIRQSDFILAEGLDEQKYKDVVEVFGLFGLTCDDHSNLLLITLGFGKVFIDNDNTVQFCGTHYRSFKRKLTYEQIMTIGKLKRAMIESDEALIDAVENTLILKDTLVAAKDNQLVCGKPKAEFVAAIDKVKTLEGVLCTPKASSDCKELNLNVVITGEGRYILDCESNKEYTVNSNEDYEGVVGAIRLLQKMEK